MGAPVKQLMLPDLNFSVEERVGIWDLWASAYLEGMDTVTTLFDYGYEDIARYIEAWQPEHERGVMMVWLLGNGIDVQYDKHGIVARHNEVSFGIDGSGCSIAPHTGGKHLFDTDPTEVLGRGVKFRVFSPPIVHIFNTLYDVKGKDEALAFISVFKFYPNPLVATRYVDEMTRFNYRPSPAKLEELFTMLRSADDPIDKLRKILCPHWIKRNDFIGLFGPHCQRVREPSEKVRENQIKKLCKFFQVDYKK